MMKPSHMYHWLWCKLRQRSASSDTEYFKLQRLEQAEAELAALRKRSEGALQFLTARHERNHWGESVYNMITGSKGGYS